jgi:hypothetical protein
VRGFRARLSPLPIRSYPEQEGEFVNIRYTAAFVASTVAVALATTSNSHAAYTFTPIADSSGPLSQPMNAAINNAGARSWSSG